MAEIVMTNKARKAAKGLAVAYGMFLEAASATTLSKDWSEMTASELNGIYVASFMLLAQQEKIGIELHKPETLEYYKTKTEAEQDRRKKLAA